MDVRVMIQFVYDFPLLLYKDRLGFSIEMLYWMNRRKQDLQFLSLVDEIGEWCSYKAIESSSVSSG